MKNRSTKGKIRKYIISGMLLFSVVGLPACGKNPDESAEIKKKDEQIAALQAQINQLQDSISALQEQLDEAKEDKEDLAELIQSLNTQIEQLNAVAETLQATINSLNEHNDELQALYDAALAQIAQLQQTIEELEEQAKCHITFDSNGGSSVASQVFAPGGYITEPANPTRTGYEFAGWVYGTDETPWDFHEKVYNDITLKATWTANTYTAKFVTNGGSAISNKTATYDQSFSIPNTTKSGYTLHHWEDGKKTVNKTFTWKYTTTTTFTATWAKNNPKITYILNYPGAESYEETWTYNQAYTLYNPSRTGYTFLGWKYEGSYISGGTYTYLDDITVTAEWSANDYTLTLIADEDNPTETTSQTVTFDGSFDLPVCEDLSESRPFAGWFLNETRITNEEGHALNNWALADNATLVAKYFFPLSTKEDFAKIADNPTATYCLVNDIDFENTEIEPFAEFQGTLWGMGYIIKNLCFETDINKVGLFERLNNATIENIKFKDSSINITGHENNYYAGLLAPESVGTTTFNSVEFENINLVVKSDETKVTVGGLVGVAENLVLNNIYSKGTVWAKSVENSAYSGGFVGECLGNINAENYHSYTTVKSDSFGGINSELHITYDGAAGGLVGVSNTTSFIDVINEGNILADSEEKTYSYAGGLIGKNKGKPEFKDARNFGTVTGTSYAGGIIGCNNSSTPFVLSGCFNYGNISDNGQAGYLGGIIGRCPTDIFINGTYNLGDIITTDGYAGGLVGSAESTVTIDQSYNEGLVKAVNGSAGGLVGSAATAVIRDCYSLGTIEAKNYAGGIIGVNTLTNPSILNSFVGGTVRLTNNSVSGKVGGFIGKSVSSILNNSFVFAELIGLQNGVSAHVGEYTGVTADKVPSAAVLKDLSGNVISDSSTAISIVSLETFTSEYLKSTLLFKELKWNLGVDFDSGIYPTLKCFGE